MPVNTKTLYETLKKDTNYSGIGNTLESFKAYFSKPENANKLYSTLSADENYEGIGKDINSFTSYFGLKGDTTVTLPKQPSVTDLYNKGNQAKPVVDYKKTGDVIQTDNTNVIQPQRTAVSIEAQTKRKQFVDKAIDNAIIIKNKKYGVPEERINFDEGREQILAGLRNKDIAIDENGKIKRTAGFGESFKMTADKIHQKELDDAYLANLNREDAITYLNNKMKYPELYNKEDEAVPSGVLGALGEFGGENAAMIGKGTVGAMVGGYSAMTGGASFGTFMGMIDDAAAGGYSNALQRNYTALKSQDPNISDDEAYDKAHKAALVGEVVGIGTNALLSTTIFAKEPKFQKAADGFINGIKQSAKHTLETSPKMIGSGIAGSLINDATAKVSGVDVTLDETLKNASESAKAMAVLHFGLGVMPALVNGVRSAIPNYLRPQLENILSLAPRDEVQQFYSKAEQEGAIPQGTTEKIITKLDEFGAEKQKLDGLKLDEENKAAITGKMLQINGINNKISELEARKAAMPPALYESIDEVINTHKEEIAAIDKQIGEMQKSGKPLEQEVDNLTGEKLVYTEMPKEPTGEELPTVTIGGKEIKPETKKSGVTVKLPQVNEETNLPTIEVGKNEITIPEENTGNKQVDKSQKEKIIADAELDKNKQPKETENKPLVSGVRNISHIVKPITENDLAKVGTEFYRKGENGKFEKATINTVVSRDGELSASAIDVNGKTFPVGSLKENSGKMLSDTKRVENVYRTAFKNAEEYGKKGMNFSLVEHELQSSDVVASKEVIAELKSVYENAKKISKEKPSTPKESEAEKQKTKPQPKEGSVGVGGDVNDKSRTNENKDVNERNIIHGDVMELANKEGFKVKFYDGKGKEGGVHTSGGNEISLNKNVAKGDTTFYLKGVEPDMKGSHTFKLPTDKSILFHEIGHKMFSNNSELGHQILKKLKDYKKSDDFGHPTEYSAVADNLFDATMMDFFAFYKLAPKELKSSQPKVFELMKEWEDAYKSSSRKSEKNVRIEVIDFENKSETINTEQAAKDAEKIAKNNNVNILRGKDLKSVAVDKEGKTVGGLWTEVNGDEFSFDVAIDKTSQGQRVGENLVKDAISEFNNEKEANPNLKYKVDVTNPIMEKLLSKYGFKVSERVGDHTIMEHPTNKPKAVEQSLKETTKAETKPKTKLQKLADKIENEGWEKAVGLPLPNLPEGTQKAGFNSKEINKALANAIRAVDKLVESGEKTYEAIQEAIEEGFKIISDYYNENTKSWNKEAVRKEYDNFFNQFYKKELENVPPIKETKVDTDFSKEAFSNLSKKERIRGVYQHLIDSKVGKEISDKLKDVSWFKEKTSNKSKEEIGIKYKVADNAEAQVFGKGILKEFGVDEALKLARLDTFHPSVNSAVFAEAIDHYRNAEVKAKTQQEKFDAAKKWADTFDEYAELGTGAGQFTSYMYNFYKTSKLGFLLSAEKKFKEKQDYFINRDEKSINEAYDKLMEIPEFADLFVGKVEEAKAKSKQTLKAEQKKKISDGWDKLKLKSDNLYAVPVPTTIINGAIEAMKRVHLLGYEVADVVKEGIDYINKHHKEGWDEAKFKKEQTDNVDALNKVAEVSSKQRLDTYKENLKNQISSIDEQIAAKKRKAKTQKEFELDDEAKSLIEERTAKRKQLNEAVPLEGIAKKILDKWEKKLNKLSPEKKKELASKIVAEIVQNGGLDRETFQNIYAEALGLPTMTPEMKTKLIDLGGKLSAVDEAKEKLDADATKENVDSYIKAMKEGEEASRQINHLLGEKGISLDRFLSIAKLNTLGVANLLMNPLFNVNYMPFRFGESLISTGLDYGLKYVGLPRNEGGVYENVFYKNMGYFKGMREGIAKSVDGILKGETTYNLHEQAVRQNIRPIGSIKEIIAHHKGEQPLTTAEYANAVMEAFPTMGMSAAFISRALQVGDLPFRFAAERAALESIARQKGLTGLKKDAFILSPDEASVEIMKKEGDKAVQSQQNLLTSTLNSISNAFKQRTSESTLGKVAGTVSKVVGATTQPFLKIPINNAYTVAQLVIPEMSVLEGIYQATIAKDRTAALKAFSRAVIGLSLGAALNQLGSVGIISATGDEKEKINVSIAKEDESGGNNVNITALRRYINGGDPTPQDGDWKPNLNVLGVVGSMMAIYGAKYDKLPQSEWAKLGRYDDLTERLSGAFVNGMKNNVMGNTSTLISAISDGNAYSANKWLRGALGVLENSFDPSWLATASRISDNYKPDYTAMGTMEAITAQIKERVGKGGELPSQVTVWGEKRTDAPKGRNPFAYYYLDITKSRNVDVNDFGYNILAIYDRTKDDKVIPSRPQKTIRGNDATLVCTPKQYEEYQILVGKQRKELTKLLMNSPEFNSANDKEKVELLGNAYKQGAEIGLLQLKNKYFDDFNKAGFFKEKEEKSDIIIEGTANTVDAAADKKYNVLDSLDTKIEKINP